MRRLGILLVEIILGTTVFGTICDDNGIITTITFLEGERNNMVRVHYSIDEVMENVRPWAHGSERYTAAIKHCFTAQFPEARDDAQTRDLLV